jgi:hypothetical protein
MNTGNQNYGHLYGISSFLFLFSGSCFVTVFSGNATTIKLLGTAGLKSQIVPWVACSSLDELVAHRITDESCHRVYFKFAHDVRAVGFCRLHTNVKN